VVIWVACRYCSGSSTNRAGRSITMLIETNTLVLSHHVIISGFSELMVQSKLCGIRNFTEVVCQIIGMIRFGLA